MLPGSRFPPSRSALRRNQPAEARQVGGSRGRADVRLNLERFAPAPSHCGTSAAMPFDVHTIVLLIRSALQPINSCLCDAQKSWRFCLKTAIEAASHNKEGRLRMKTVLAACLVIGPLVAFSGTAANAIDLAELAPCRPAAARLCDRSDGITWTNLLRCGAVLAAHSWRVGNECRAVLRKYGQL